MRTVNDVPVPPRVDPEAALRTLYAHCCKSTVFGSQRDDWCRRHPGYDGLDYLHALLKRDRDAGTLPQLPNAASLAAYVLTIPPNLAEGWQT